MVMENGRVVMENGRMFMEVYNFHVVMENATRGNGECRRCNGEYKAS